MESTMDPGQYDEGYWERGEGSNYVRYGDDPGWGPTVAAIAEFMPPDPVTHVDEQGLKTKRNPRLLEVACAKGYFVRAARNAGFDAVGIDLSHWAVDHVAAGMESFVQQGNAVDLPWPDAQFDVVCSWEFLEHVPKDELAAVMGEMSRVVRAGGLLVHRIGTLEAGTDLSDHLHDSTHVTNEPATWWRRTIATTMPWLPRPDIEDGLNRRFADRDWHGRYFAYTPW